jgi:hypothetical protein
MQRRDCLKLIAGAALLPTFAANAVPTTAGPITVDDEAFLDDMQRRGCLFFVEQSNAKNGQVLDRATANNTNGKLDSRQMASIAATGFGLSALCIAEHRDYQPHAKVLEQVRRTLHSHLNVLQQSHGFLYHFNDIDSCEPMANSELSPIDTTLLLCGVLTARAYFPDDAEIVDLATKLYERVDWSWMLNGGDMLDMGVRGGKFIPARWNHYCELMMMYLLAIGSPTHPIPASSWDAWSRPTMHYNSFTYISANDPLFVHQYSHAWFDFRNKRDKYADYFANSIVATKAHQSFCVNLGKPYSLDYWGISASDSQHGYTAWGGPSSASGATQGFGGVDGSVVPYATAGSLPFVPLDCLRVQRALKANYGRYAWGRYGFCDAFHPQANWYDPDVLGIDLGLGVLMAENLRTGFVWETFARNPEVGIAMKLAGFHSS